MNAKITEKAPKLTRAQRRAAKANKTPVATPVEASTTPAEAPAVETAAEATEATEAPARKKGSIVPPKYKRLYGKAGNCGDEMAQKLTAAVSTKTGLDVAALNAVGDQNGIDVETRWGGLNAGQRRMNLGNVLRNRLRAGERVQIGKDVWNEEVAEGDAQAA